MSWFSKPALAVGAILLSIVLWVYVQTQIQATDHDFSNVPLEIRGLSDGLTLLAAKNLVVKKMTAHGPSDLLNRIQAEDLKPYIDLSGVGPVTKSFPVRLEQAARDKERGIEWTIPAQTLTIDSYSHLDLAVRVDTIGSLASPNLRFVDADVSPAHVRITGAQSLIKQVHTARVVLDLTTLRQGTVATLDVELLKRDMSPVQELTVDPRSVKVSPILAAAEQRRLLLVQPSFQGTQPAFGYTVKNVKVEPAQVRVFGPSRLLAELGSNPIGTEKIDLSGLTQTRTFQVPLDPDEIRGLRPEPRTVQVTVEITPPAGLSPAAP